jgi:phosphoserine phosphatase
MTDLQHLDARIDDLCRKAREGVLGPRPYAALDFDGTCIRGDVGEMLHYFLVEHLRYAFDGGFWDAVAEEDVPPSARQRFHEASRAELLHDRQWQTDVIAVYARRFLRLGQRNTYGWAASMHAGLTPDDVAAAARDLLALEKGRPCASDKRMTSDGLPVTLHRGIRSRPLVQDWVRRLDAAGVPTWVVSATNMWAVSQAADLELGVPADRVIGNRCELRAGRVSLQVCEPVVMREGKVQALQARRDDRPVWVMGDTWSDAALLGYASELAVLLDRGDESLRQHATESGWQIVPHRALDANENP